MMQVKYRAWDKITNDWYDDKKQDLFVGLDGEIMNCWNGELMDDYTDRITLIQYAGQKDKNGVEIYEGDILKFSNIFDKKGYFKKDVVVYEGSSFQCNYALISEYNTNTIEIIGNIHTNPELLEVSHN